MERIRQMLEAIQRDRELSGSSKPVDLFPGELQRKVKAARPN